MLCPADMASASLSQVQKLGGVLQVPTFEPWVVTADLTLHFFIAQIPKFIFTTEHIKGLCLHATQAAWFCPVTAVFVLTQELICLKLGLNLLRLGSYL